jgi:hypothetical protein
MNENNITYTEFFNQVRASIANGTFAKLTLAKTVGKPELQNIYVRIIIVDSNIQLSVTFKSYNNGIIETEKIIPIAEMEAELIPYLANPFLTALLFTTEADISLKINKKRNASIIEQPPTFKNADANLVEFLGK